MCVRCPPQKKKKKNDDCVCRLYAWRKAVGFTLNYAPRSYGYFFYCYFIFFFGCRWCVLKSVYSPLPFAHYSMHTHTRIYLLFIIVVGCCFHCFFFFLDQQRCCTCGVISVYPTSVLSILIFDSVTSNQSTLVMRLQLHITYIELEFKYSHRRFPLSKC